MPPRKQKLVLVGPDIVGKKCTTCGETKALTEFHRRYKFTYEASCKKCRNNRNKGNKDYNRRHLLKKYNLTHEEYEQLYQLQEGKCLICRKEFPVLDIDHDHKTNIIRGLLCRKCNGGLGLFNDTIEFLENAIAYLKRA